VRSSAHILLEGTPANVDLDALRADLLSILPPEADVHHVHAWSLTAEQSLVTLHVRCGEQQDSEKIIAAVNARLKERYGIGHSTVQVEPYACADETH